MEEKTKRLLDLRKNIKKKKPEFTRQDLHKKKKLDRKWRKPKGLHSKLREHRKGHRKSVSTGYGSPREIKGLSGEGLIPKIISNIKDLKRLKKERNGVIIQGTLGKRKRLMMVEECKKLSLKILNLKNPEEYVKRVKEELAAKKEARKKRKESKEEKAKKTKEKKEKKAEKTEMSDEEQRIAEKKEKDEALIHTE